MRLFDILFRVDEICKKYDKYDPDKQRELNTSVGDAFSRVNSIVDAEIENALRKSKMEAMEANKAKKVALSADIRRIKARLAEEVAKLHKLATKKDTRLFLTGGFEKVLRIYDLNRPDTPPSEVDKSPGSVRVLSWLHSDQTILSTCTDIGGVSELDSFPSCYSKLMDGGGACSWIESRHRRGNSETFCAQYINTKDVRVTIATWNVARKIPDVDLDIDEWLSMDEPANIYIIGIWCWNE